MRAEDFLLMFSGIHFYQFSWSKMGARTCVLLALIATIYAQDLSFNEHVLHHLHRNTRSIKEAIDNKAFFGVGVSLFFISNFILIEIKPKDAMEVYHSFQYVYPTWRKSGSYVSLQYPIQYIKRRGKIRIQTSSQISLQVQ